MIQEVTDYPVYLCHPCVLGVTNDEWEGEEQRSLFKQEWGGHVILDVSEVGFSNHKCDGCLTDVPGDRHFGTLKEIVE